MSMGFRSTFQVVGWMNETHAVACGLAVTQRKHTGQDGQDQEFQAAPQRGQGHTALFPRDLKADKEWPILEFLRVSTLMIK